MLVLVKEAEEEYGDKTGKLKRSAIFEKIYEKYPVLKLAINQTELEKEIDKMIDKNLEDLKKMLEDKDAFYKEIEFYK